MYARVTRNRVWPSTRAGTAESVPPCGGLGSPAMSRTRIPLKTRPVMMPFARFAWSVLAYEVAVVAWGAYVRATGSGGGCGSHWPLCNGVVVPRGARSETLIELSHRLSSGVALVLMVFLFGWAVRSH